MLRRKSSVALLALLAGALLLVLVVRRPTTSGGGALRCVPDVTVEEPFTPLHPLRTFSGPSAELLDLVYAPVLRRGDGLPGAARIVSESLGSIDLLLEDATFHDGSRVTPEDLVWSLNEYLGAAAHAEIAGAIVRLRF